MTLGDMLDGRRGIFNRLNLPARPSLTTLDRITGFLNETLEDLVSEPGMSQWILANAAAFTLTSVADQDTYAAPFALSRIDAISDRTNNRKLEMMPFEEWRARCPEPLLFSGTPSHWVPRGIQAYSGNLIVQTLGAGTLYVASSSTADTTQKVYLDGLTTAGLFRTTAAAGTLLTGTTRVAIGTATDLTSVTRWFVDQICTGDLSLYADATAVTPLAVLPAASTSARMLAFALYPTPAAALTYSFDGEISVSELSDPTDEPPIPSQFHRLLVDGALAREYVVEDDDRAPQAKQKYNQGVAQLRYYLTCPPDFLPTRGRPRGGHSRLGAWFSDGAGYR